MRLPDRFAGVDQRRPGAARVSPDEIADQDKIRACAGEFESLLARDGKAYARRLEQFIPPLQALGNRLHRGPLPACIRLAEQHVIRAQFAGGHGIVPRGEAADAGDAVGLQRRQGILQRGQPAQMRAVGAAPRHQFDMAIEQQRRAGILDRGRERLHARDHRALIGLLQPHQHRRHVGGGEQLGKLRGELRRIVELCCRQIKPRRRARRNRFAGQVFFSQV